MLHVLIQLNVLDLFYYIWLNDILLISGNSQIDRDPLRNLQTCSEIYSIRFKMATLFQIGSRIKCLFPVVSSPLELDYRRQYLIIIILKEYYSLEQ